MGFLSSIFGGGGGGSSQTTTVYTSTNVTVSPQIANVVDLGAPLQALIDALSKNQDDASAVYALSAAANIQAAQAQQDAAKQNADMLSRVVEGLSENVMFIALGIGVYFVFKRWK